jgi:very-short-patch-repair endonuclease
MARTSHPGVARTSDPDVLCTIAAVEQHGLILRHQALAAGLSKSGIDRRLRRGLWRKVDPGVYASAAVEATFEQRVLAACCFGGEGTLASHRSAARILELEGCEDDIIEVSSIRRLRAPDVVTHRLPRRISRRWIRRIPVTSVERCLFDLGAVARDAAVEQAVEDALRRRLTTPQRLRSMIEQPCHGRPGAATLRRLLKLHDRSTPTDSGLEVEMELLLRRYRLPPPTRQHPWACRDGIVLHPDLSYPEANLVIECEGFRWHGAMHQRWERDIERVNLLTEAGVTVLRFTVTDVRRRPRRTAQRIAARLPTEVVRRSSFCR